MPLVLCRWPNGDCSIVWARSRIDAIEHLDQIGNAEGCLLEPLRRLQLHFALTDKGDLEVVGFGDGTREEILSRAYPLLDQTLQEAYGDGAYDGFDSLPPTRQTAIATAVEHERERMEVDKAQIAEPGTGFGRDLKRETDLPTVLVDRLVRTAAKTTLKRVKSRAKPS